MVSVAKGRQCLTIYMCIPSLSRGVLNVSPFILHGEMALFTLLYRNVLLSDHLRESSFLWIIRKRQIKFKNYKDKFYSVLYNLSNDIIFESIHLISKFNYIYMYHIHICIIQIYIYIWYYLYHIQQDKSLPTNKLNHTIFQLSISQLSIFVDINSYFTNYYLFF